MKQKWIRTLLVDLCFDIIGSILYSVGIYTFAKTAGFAPGGLSGLALIINYLWGLPIGVMTLVLNIPLLLLSYRFVGRRFLLKTMQQHDHLHCFFGSGISALPSLYRDSVFSCALFRRISGRGFGIFLYARFLFGWYRFPDHVDQCPAAAPGPSGL